MTPCQQFFNLVKHENLIGDFFLFLLQLKPRYRPRTFYTKHQKRVSRYSPLQEFWLTFQNVFHFLYMTCKEGTIYANNIHSQRAIIPARCKACFYLAQGISKINLSCSFKQSWNTNIESSNYQNSHGLTYSQKQKWITYQIQVHCLPNMVIDILQPFPASGHNCQQHEFFVIAMHA